MENEFNEYKKKSLFDSVACLKSAIDYIDCRSKLPSVKNAVGQNGRRSNIPSVGQKFCRSENGRRSKLRRSKYLEPARDLSTFNSYGFWILVNIY
jgi:hypothetical protein